MKKVFEVMCEWDVGQENVMFLSEPDAMAWINENKYIKDIVEDNEGTIEELFDEELIIIKAREVWEPERIKW